MSERIAVVGGTGALGSALAARWANAGLDIIIGSRDAQKAAQVAADMSGTVAGMSNVDAAAQGDVIVLTVPWSSHADTIESIASQLSGKLLVDTTVPLMPPKVAVVQLPAAGSAAVTASLAVGEDVLVASGFHNVAAAKLALTGPVDGDVLVFGDKKAARDKVIELAQAAGLSGIHGGALANSAAAEAMTSVLISINKRYKSPGSAIRITGIDS